MATYRTATVTTDFTRIFAAIYSRGLARFSCSLRGKGLLCAGSLGQQSSRTHRRIWGASGQGVRRALLAAYGRSPSRRRRLGHSGTIPSAFPSSLVGGLGSQIDPPFLSAEKALLLRKDMLRLSSRDQALGSKQNRRMYRLAAREIDTRFTAAHSAHNPEHSSASL